jgi:Lon protease-like protein
MSDLLPIFPLPNVVLFPTVFLPLHIFEPRYREMVADAIAGDRMIGMALFRPGWEHDYEGRPPVHGVACSGLITHVETLSDGRYNIVLRGVERVRILREDSARRYRRALVEPLPEASLLADDRAVIRRHRERLEAMLASVCESTGGQGLPSTLRASKVSKAADLKIPASMADEDLVNALAQYLDLEPLEKQALLERPSLRARAESLVELLEMKIIMARSPSRSETAH